MRAKVGPWKMTADKCGAYRAYLDKDGEKIENRVAFVEKTPRIRIRAADMSYAGWGLPLKINLEKDFLNWASGPLRGDGPEDDEARAWCDKALVLFGYEV